MSCLWQLAGVGDVAGLIPFLKLGVGYPEEIQRGWLGQRIARDFVQFGNCFARQSQSQPTFRSLHEVDV